MGKNEKSVCIVDGAQLCGVVSGFFGLEDFAGWLSLVSVVTFDVDSSFCVSRFPTQVWSYFWHCITTDDTYGTMSIEKYYEVKVNIHDSYWSLRSEFFRRNRICLIG
jgi:hypothetical protein